MGSSVSVSDAQYPTSINGTPTQYQPDEVVYSPRAPLDDMGHGWPRGLSSPNSVDTPPVGTKRARPWPDGQFVPANSPGAMGLPWLNQATDPRFGPAGYFQSPDSVPSLTPVHSQGDSSGRGSRSSGTESRPPSLKTEPSSTGSMSSHGSYNFPRTPSDASLPIHALLSSKPDSYPPQQQQQGPPPVLNHPGTKATPPMFQGPPSRSPADPSTNGAFVMPMTSADPRTSQPTFRPGEQPYPPPGFTTEQHLSPPIDSRPPNGTIPPNPAEPNLDGISALLKAKEIVDRRPY